MRRKLSVPRRVGARRHLLRAGLAEQAGARPIVPFAPEARSTSIARIVGA